MSTHTNFMTAIIAHPADDGPRLIYADWLEEHDQGERAEFIRVQCEVERFSAAYVREPGPCRPEAKTCFDVLRRRERELLGTHPNWSHDVGVSIARRDSNWAVSPPGGLALLKRWPDCAVLPTLEEPGQDAHIQYIFRRGFVAEVRCTWEDWLRHADAIRATQPIETARLTTAPLLDWLEQTDSTPPVTTFAFVGDRRATRVNEWLAPIQAGGLAIESIGEVLLEKRWPGIRFTLPVGHPEIAILPTPTCRWGSVCSDNSSRPLAPSPAPG